MEKVENKPIHNKVSVLTLMQRRKIEQNMKRWKLTALLIIGNIY